MRRLGKTGLKVVISALFLLLTVFLLITGAVTGCKPAAPAAPAAPAVPAAPQKVYELKATTYWPKSHFAQINQYDYFTKLIQEYSGGRIHFTTYYDGTLAKMADQVTAVETGVADFTWGGQSITPEATLSVVDKVVPGLVVRVNTGEPHAYENTGNQELMLISANLTTH